MGVALRPGCYCCACAVPCKRVSLVALAHTKSCSPSRPPASCPAAAVVIVHLNDAVRVARTRVQNASAAELYYTSVPLNGGCPRRQC